MSTWWGEVRRYFDVEPRIVPLEESKYTIGPEDVEPHLDENTIGVVAVLGTTFTGHKDDVVGIGALLRDVREKRDLDIPIHVDGATGASMVLAQYYNFVRLGRQGYTYVMKMMQENARVLADNLRSSSRFEVIGSDLEQLPLVAFRLADKGSYDESDIAWQLSAERGCRARCRAGPGQARHRLLILWGLASVPIAGLQRVKERVLR